MKEQIKKDLKVFNAITGGIQRVFDKAGVEYDVLIAVKTDKPLCMVGISDEMDRRTFARAIRDLVYTKYGEDVEQFVDDFAEVLELKGSMIKM